MNTKKKFKLGPIQRAWVRALRSGKYKQCKAKLTQLDGDKPVAHCCLGVLCELAVKSGVKLRIGVDASNRQYNGEDDVLPPAVRKWASLQGNTGEFYYESLAGHNDSGQTFKSIANTIEKHAEKIFEESR